MDPVVIVRLVALIVSEYARSAVVPEHRSFAGHWICVGDVEVTVWPEREALGLLQSAAVGRNERPKEDACRCVVTQNR